MTDAIGFGLSRIYAGAADLVAVKPSEIEENWP